MFQNLRFTVYRNDQGAPRAVGKVFTLKAINLHSKIVIPANVIKQEEEDHWFALSNAFYEDKGNLIIILLLMNTSPGKGLFGNQMPQVGRVL